MVAQLTEYARPIPAVSEFGPRTRGVDAVTMLTVYVVLLVAIPSNLSVAALGSLGRPSFLWGILLLGWWALARLQTPNFAVRPIYQPVRLALGLLAVTALISLAAALLRGQPADQVSPAITGVARLLSWCGVLLVAMDGLRTMVDVSRMLRRLVVAGAMLGLLGIAQFVTGQGLVDFYSSIPGFTGVDGGVDARGSFTRSSATATHPLEYATALSAILPLAIATAIAHGFRPGASARKLLWWAPVAIIAVSSLLAVSRSAIVGFAVALIATLPGLPARYRAFVVTGGLVVAAGIVVAVPGLLGTMIGLFSSAGSDASTTSRVNGLDRAPEFIATSPVFGNGLGTFLPRYYIFDNQWVLLAVELGIVGVLAFAGILISAIWAAWHAGRVSGHADVVLVGRALAASVLTAGVLFAFFDAFSFPIAPGLLVLIVGLCCAVRTVAAADAHIGTSPARRWDPHDA